MPLSHLYALLRWSLIFLLSLHLLSSRAPSVQRSRTGKSLVLLLFKLGRWTAGEHCIDRPLKASFSPLPFILLSLSSLTTNCLAFTTPSSRLTSGPIAGHFSPSISSFFFSSDASGGHKFTRESGRAGGSAVYLSNNHHHGVEKQRNGGLEGLRQQGVMGRGWWVVLWGQRGAE